MAILTMAMHTITMGSLTMATLSTIGSQWSLPYLVFIGLYCAKTATW